MGFEFDEISLWEKAFEGWEIWAVSLSVWILVLEIILKSRGGHYK